MAANEIIHHCKRYGMKAFLIKLDLSKAFDSIHWDFLYELLYKRGFPERWVRWIKMILHSSEFAVLLNGTPDLYASSLRKHVMLADVWDGRNQSWRLRWRSVSDSMERGKFMDILNNSSFTTVEDKTF
ncbi:hypothetical protein Cni_G07410 [Canna indica]|uniref:Reverse transcriptase domain-containing protein n=1 Tax=Canna indica TaxID=4628 RepID=A0AAQ3K091_9LILI|nr:hypothetical protein Cni_G07410 [Canna indica]